ncbi:hypothetical protein AGMMS50230_22600 [Spirochaetia bacterium]|nr:hypothetical protein AGMMS50230_22600 [Spirochaetia bacterium]
MIIRYLTIFPGFIICALLFCISIILLIVKRKTLQRFIRIIFIIVAIISFGFICLVIVFEIVNSVAIIGGADGPTAIYVNELNNKIMK